MPSPFVFDAKIAGLCAVVSQTDLSQNQGPAPIQDVQIVMVDHVMVDHVMHHSPVLVFDAEDLVAAPPNQDHLLFFEQGVGGHRRLLGLWRLRNRTVTLTAPGTDATSLQGQNLAHLPAVGRIDTAAGVIRPGFLTTPPQETCTARLDLTEGQLETIDRVAADAGYRNTDGGCYSGRFALRLHYTLPFDDTVVLTGEGFGPDLGVVETLELRAAQNSDARVEISNFPRDRHYDHSAVFPSISTRRSGSGWPRPRRSATCDPSAPVFIGEGLGCSPHSMQAS
jgi:hypothetical protein